MRRDGIRPVGDVQRKSIFCARTDAHGTNVAAVSLASAKLTISGFGFEGPESLLALARAARYF